MPLQIIEERLVGPTLGMESIKAGIKACIIAAGLVFIIMLGYYRFFWTRSKCGSDYKFCHDD